MLSPHYEYHHHPSLGSTPSGAAKKIIRNFQIVHHSQARHSLFSKNDFFLPSQSRPRLVLERPENRKGLFGLCATLKRDTHFFQITIFSSLPDSAPTRCGAVKKIMRNFRIVHFSQARHSLLSKNGYCSPLQDMIIIASTSKLSKRIRATRSTGRSWDRNALVRCTPGVRRRVFGGGLLLGYHWTPI